MSFQIKRKGLAVTDKSSPNGKPATLRFYSRPSSDFRFWSLRSWRSLILESNGFAWFCGGFLACCCSTFLLLALVNLPDEKLTTAEDVIMSRIAEKLVEKR